MNPTRRHLLLGGLGLGVAAAWPAWAQDAPVIAVASDLSFAIRELVDRFAADTGQQVQVTLGSTGNFARQIRAGAPFQMFMAADESFVLDLAAEGLTDGQGALYAEGRLSIVVPKGSVLKADGTLHDLGRALGDGRLNRFAIANPEHAPYGKRAQEALEHTGLWEAIKPSLVLGENVAQAAQFAVSGNADGGLIAHSLALAPDLGAGVQSALIPAEWHNPLLQRMVLLRDAGPVARAFYAYVQTAPARDILARYGFSLPGQG
ncbi:molybdate ABC transporter substrate-binding protein [Donghicola mangrovi]|uniref:Molybdate ABC transporter substrate-binding protein n=1 Tax=Donghicola mangrovi TaxID=2729614 RepID=A0A850Q586_9RHOB|nr:molybdate ABC transporter substrate-binding protein [Donghicola mangrovi]NVO23262.1 molybdate ABC transporter substrate-binding protein [Donghicola mangrovi]